MDNFDSYGSGDRPDYDFYTQDAAQWIKTASVPILLLGLPVLALIGAVRRRWVGAAQTYVVLFILLITWYWQMLRFF